MQITFYGVRGSIAYPGEDTAKYGGNTSCVYAKTAAGTQLILDAGTGIRKLGEELVAEAESAQLEKMQDIYLLFSHYHSDHIQGFPFFRPIYQAQQNIYIAANHLDPTASCPVLGQMGNPNFPVPKEELPSTIKHLPFNSDGSLNIDDAHIHTRPLNHSGGGSGYRINTPAGSMAYITDNELKPDGVPNTSFKQWEEFVSEVDILIHDAMLIESEEESHRGWGHSSMSQACQLALDAKVKKLILFHHKPGRTDKDLDALLQHYREWMASKGSDCEVLMAREGDSYQY